MAVIAEIVRGAGRLLVPGGLLALEVDSRRGDRVIALVRASGAFASAELVQDLAGRDRFVFAVRTTAGQRTAVSR
jgi:release factor glutamine methyltransferase